MLCMNIKLQSHVQKCPYVPLQQAVPVTNMCTNEELYTYQQIYVCIYINIQSYVQRNAYACL